MVKYQGRETNEPRQRKTEKRVKRSDRWDIAQSTLPLFSMGKCICVPNYTNINISIITSRKKASRFTIQLTVITRHFPFGELLERQKRTSCRVHFKLCVFPLLHHSPSSLAFVRHCLCLVQMQTKRFLSSQPSLVSFAMPVKPSVLAQHMCYAVYNDNICSFTSKNS